MTDETPILRLSLYQTDIAWEDKNGNLQKLNERLKTLRGQTDIVVLPETFSTGFGAKTAQVAERTDGLTVNTLRTLAQKNDIALAGSFLACETAATDGRTLYYNRAFFLTPQGDASFYDKRHLFGNESRESQISPGTARPVVCYRGWNILLQICYDLRFPVWSRNVDMGYDLALYFANWPASRRMAWDILLRARAIENLCYVAGVNRTGTDSKGTPHNGGSATVSYKGNLLASVPDGQEGIATTLLDLNELRAYRQKFPAWKDADRFTLIPS